MRISSSSCGIFCRVGFFERKFTLVLNARMHCKTRVRVVKKNSKHLTVLIVENGANLNFGKVKVELLSENSHVVTADVTK